MLARCEATPGCAEERDAGLSSDARLRGLARREQWMGMEGMPRTTHGLSIGEPVHLSCWSGGGLEALILRAAPGLRRAETGTWHGYDPEVFVLLHRELSRWEVLMGAQHGLLPVGDYAVLRRSARRSGPSGPSVPTGHCAPFTAHHHRALRA